ncbi:MAG TPA: hypothetical protein VEW90_09985 [Gaiellaceae bacterium]|nr:hypothetical protein [Gaiellaceae bacterium]
MPTVTIRDETRPGRAIAELALPGLPDRISVRELIRSRVREEVAQANLDRQSSHRLLVLPTDAESSLNGYRLRTPRLIDWEAQAEVALKAFDQNAFFVIVDGKQVDSLDDELELAVESQIRFLRLTPLVGG